jgi:hypothetical protein
VKTALIPAPPVLLKELFVSPVLRLFSLIYNKASALKIVLLVFSLKLKQEHAKGVIFLV